MKLNKLRVQRFRNITDTTLDTGGAKFVVVRGPNRNGKTSLAEALSLTLTNTTWGLTAKGDGYARKIKRGEPKATLEAELQGANRTIKRTVTLNVNSVGRTQESEDINDPDWLSALWDKLLVNKKAAVDIALNTRAFMSMVYSRDEDAQKNLLAQLVLPAKYDFDKETVADVEKYLGQDVVNFAGEPFAAINLAYKKLFDERKDTNKKVKEFVMPAPLPRPQGVDSESLNVKLLALKEHRNIQATKRDAAAKQATEEAVARERTKARVATLEAVLKASKEELMALKMDVLAEPQIFEATARRKAERDALMADKSRRSHAQGTAKAEQVRLLGLQKLGATCGTCGQDLDEEKLAHLIGASIAEHTRLGAEEDRIASALTLLSGVDDAISKLEKHKKAMAEMGEVTTRIEMNAAELKEASKHLDKDAGGLFDSSKFDDSLTSTDKAIEAILQQIQPVIAAEEREKEIAAKDAQLTRLEDKGIKLDTLVKYFDKDGIKAKLIKDHIGGFEERVNSVLRAWDYSCSLSIEPFKFEVTNYRKDTSPLIDLSGAEELMFYAAFQCAVAKTAGIGFAVIDRIDTLLPDLRPILFKNLYKMVGDGTLDQVILLVADTSEQVPPLAGSAFFMIEEGMVRRL